MKKVVVKEIKNYDYVLSDGKKIYKKNIEFYSHEKPMVGDIIYIDDKVLEEMNMFSFDNLYEDKNATTKDIIKVVSGKKEYYLQRIYG
jgi:uncharacterized Zn finger protein